MKALRLTDKLAQTISLIHKTLCLDVKSVYSKNGEVTGTVTIDGTKTKVFQSKIGIWYAL